MSSLAGIRANEGSSGCEPLPCWVVGSRLSRMPTSADAEGLAEEIFAERDRKLEEAPERRRLARQKEREVA